MLTKILAGLVLVLSLSLGGIGYLYTGSLKEIGRMDGVITTLTTNLIECEKNVENIRGEKDDAIDSLETVKKETQESQEAFKELEERMNSKKCGVTNATANKSTTHEQAKTGDPVVDDIADTFRVLRRAYCLSNGDDSCKDT